jgi:hypothetical protein
VGSLPPFRQLVFWTANHLFGYQQPLVFEGSGSGDKMYDWVMAFCLLVLAGAGTLFWSFLDRHRENYQRLHAWFSTFLRFALAGQLFVYGCYKVIPLQMPYPSLAKLLQPFGNFSPMGVLWASVGASPAYERFVGCAELLAGFLLIIPGMSMIGALICLMDMIEVFALNMTYDVPVKLFSLHMILMAAFLLIPYRSRLARLCRDNCAIPFAEMSSLSINARANRHATKVQIVLGLLLFVSTLLSVRQNWSKWGGENHRSPLYGIWNIDLMSIDGRVRAPLLTDYDRWRRVAFDVPDFTSFQRMDDSFTQFNTQVNSSRSKLILNKVGDRNWKGELSIKRLGADRMTLDGLMGQHRVQMELSLMDRNKFVLVNRGFHWIQDQGFNR